MLGILPLGEIAIGDIPASEDVSTPSTYWAFLADPYAARNYVIVTDPPQSGAVGEFPYALGEYPLGDMSPDELIVRPPFYWDKIGLETGPTDTPPGAVFRPCLKNPFSFSSSIPAPGERRGSGATNFGVIILANVGDLDDDLISAEWQGREISLYIGGTIHPGRSTELVLPFSDYRKRFTLRAANLTLTLDEAEIAIEDPSVVLQKTVQQETYTGAGNYEGDASTKGGSKPVALGTVYQVPGILVDETEFIYQWHDGSGGSVTVSAVFDDRVELTSAGNDTDLINATVSAGQFKTDNARGLIKVGSEPDGEITINGTGVGGSTVASIINYLADLVEQPVDEAAFVVYAQYQAGYWCDSSPVEIIAVMQRLMASIDGWVIYRGDGRLAIGEHADTVNTPATLEIEGRENADTPNVIANIRRTAGPIPAWRYRAGFKRYWSTAEGADTISAADRSDFKAEYRRADPSENFQTFGNYPEAQDLELDTFLNDEAEAKAVADALVFRDARKRGIYEIDIFRHLFTVEPGAVVKICHDRFGLDVGKTGEVLAVLDDAQAETTRLTVLINE